MVSNICVALMQRIMLYFLRLIEFKKRQQNDCFHVELKTPPIELLKSGKDHKTSEQI